MKKLTYLLVLFGCYCLGHTNPGLTECYRLSEVNYPLSKQQKTEKEISERIIADYDALYLPQMKLLGQAQYQSDVTKIELDLNISIPGFKMPEIPSPTKDQYKIGLSVSQIIWDGGLIADSKEIEIVGNKINLQNLNTQIYGLKQKINDAYFGILIIEQNIKSLELLKQDLAAKLDKISATVANGAALQLNADMLTAEILKTAQNIIKLKSKKTAAYQILSDLTGTAFAEDEGLILPDAYIPETEPLKELRPEYKSFVLAGEQIDKYSSLTDSKYMPKFSAFGQAMYGRPGLNMFESGFQAYYIVGVQASWDFWPWGTREREKEILELRKDIINSSKSTFSLGLKMQGRQLLEDIKNYGEMLRKDEEIIELKHRIAATVSAQLDNGVITVSDYLAEANAEALARLNLEIHKLELVQAKINYLVINGEIDKIK